MAIFSWRGLVCAIFSVPPSGKTTHQTPINFGGATTCSSSSISMASSVRLRFHPPARWPKPFSFFVCLSVCLLVMHLNVRDCAPDFTMNALDYGNSFHAVGYGKVSSCAPLLIFFRLSPIGDSTKCQSPKTGKNWVFSPTDGDPINQSTLHLARNRIPWLWCSASNLAIISVDRFVTLQQSTKFQLRSLLHGM